MQNNLVDNGGMLDRVHFISRVRHPADSKFLDKIIDSNPKRYTYREEPPATWGWQDHWSQDIYPDTIYIKIGILSPLTNSCTVDGRRRYCVYRREYNCGSCGI